MAGFELHSRLAADTVSVVKLDLCQVLLMQDSRYPWLILVPEQAGLKDLHDLSTQDQVSAIHEIDRASRVLQDIHQPDKLNVAALGNMVPQLHIHVIARFIGDTAWPAPVWGVGEAVPYESQVLKATLHRLREAFA